MSEPDSLTAHIAAACPRCDTAFVAITVPPGGLPVEAVAHRLARLTCPSCGASEGLAWVIGARHREAVARLRQEARME